MARVGRAHEDFRFRQNAPRAEVRSANTVLNGRVRRYHDPGFCTTLSVKSVIAGRAVYETPHSRYDVDPDRVVILAEGQEYSLDIRPRPRTETLAVFFQPGFVEHVAAARGRSLSQQLDDPVPELPALDFCERSYRKSGPLARALGTLHRTVRTAAGDPLALETAFYEVAEALLAARGDDEREIASIDAVREATRAELYRRLHWARDYIESCFAEAPSVCELARVACLSPYHFQRSFRALFGLPPGEYVQRKRMAVAARLLREASLSVTAVAAAVGYASLGTFSARFRRSFGVSPLAWRRRRN